MDDERARFGMPDLEFDPDLKVCPHCLGTGVVVEEADGERWMRRCECRESRERERALGAAGIPVRYRDYRLHTFKHEKPTLDRAYQAAKKFAADYPTVAKGLLFMGFPGLGKTHLAVGVLQLLAAGQGASCRFCDFSELLSALRTRYAFNSFDDYTLVKPLLDCDVLLIDDLGAMKIRDWTLDVLSYVVNQRYVTNKILIATTNFLDPESAAGAPAKYSELVTSNPESYGRTAPAPIPTPMGNRTEETLAERVGSRLRSRLFEMCDVVKIEGDDYRNPLTSSGLLREI